MNNHSTFGQIQSFFLTNHVAVAGVSRESRKFGNIVFRELSKRGFRVVPVNPYADTLEGVSVFKTIADLPAEFQSLVLVTQPAQTIELTREAALKGIKNIWMQPGAEHPRAIEFCNQNYMLCIHHECILMHLKPTTGIHSFHRFLRKLLRSFPK